MIFGALVRLLKSLAVGNNSQALNTKRTSLAEKPRGGPIWRSSTLEPKIIHRTTTWIKHHAISSLNATGRFALTTSLATILVLSGCGGGVSGGGTAQLGYISGGIVKLFNLSNLIQPIATTISSTSINPVNAGSFSFNGAALSANKYYLVEISGGFDIDANDDGVIDTTTQIALQGKVYALAKGSALTAGNVRINALSDMAYLKIKGNISTLTNLQIDAALASSAKAYLYDVDGNGAVNQKDILAFDPVKHKFKTIRPYKDILDIYVPKLHRGDTDAVKLTALMYLDAPKIVVTNGNLQEIPFTLKASIQLWAGQASVLRLF